MSVERIRSSERCAFDRGAIARNSARASSSVGRKRSRAACMMHRAATCPDALGVIAK